MIKFIYRILSILLIFVFSASNVSLYAQQAAILPSVGSRLALSPPFVPPLLKGIKIFRNDPFRFDFILDKGDTTQTNEQLNTESNRLIKYFLAALTVPEQDLWVNLSPYEKDRIVPDAFGQTEMGRDLLAQDYILKQITASVIYPEGKVGKEFWDKVYAESLKRYGTTNIPVDTFNKVWIIPEKATVYETKDAAFVVKSKLKVMLNSDYLAMAKNGLPTGWTNTEGSEEPSTLPGEDNSTHEMTRDIVREVVIPILEKEVNEGKNFASLRQVYHSLILATWYKRKVKDSIMGRAYVDQKKTGGIDITDKNEKEKIWQQYVAAFKTGVFNFIKDEVEPETQGVMPRKYFSGGVDAAIINLDFLETLDPSIRYLHSDKAMSIEAHLNIKEAKSQKVLLLYIVEQSSSLDFPVGIHAIKDYLQQNRPGKVDVEVRDLQLDHPEDVLEFINQWKPDILGLSIHTGSLNALDSFMKEFNANVLSDKPQLVFGNLPAFNNPKFFLNKYPKSIAVQGEGELALTGIVDHLNGEKELKDVPNLIYLDENLQQVATKRDLMPELMIAPDYESLERYVAVGANIWYESSRGCPWGLCLYCSHKAFWGANKWRNKTIEQVVEDFKVYQKLGVRKVLLSDEEFMGSDIEGIRRARGIAEALIANGINVEWFTNLRVDSIYREYKAGRGETPEEARANNKFRKETLERLFKAGLKTIYLGVETGSPTQLKRFAKGATIKEAEEAIRIAKGIGFELQVGWLINEPLVEVKEIEDSLNFIERNGILNNISTISNKMRLYPSIIYKKLIEKEEVREGKSFLKQQPHPNEMYFDVIDYKHDGVKIIMDLTTKYYESMKDLYNALKWFLRFNNKANLEEYKYIRNHSDKLRILIFDLQKNLVKAYIQGKSNAELQEIYKNSGGRAIELTQLYEDIVDNGHYQTDPDIMRIWNAADVGTASLLQESQDELLAIHQTVRKPGGIDLNPSEIDLEIKDSGETIKFNLDPVMLARLKNSSGVAPVIVAMRPLESVSAFMGVQASGVK